MVATLCNCVDACVYTCYIYIYIYMLYSNSRQSCALLRAHPQERNRSETRENDVGNGPGCLSHSDNDTGVCENSTPFKRAFALQPSSRNCSPAPDLVVCKPIFQRPPCKEFGGERQAQTASFCARSVSPDRRLVQARLTRAKKAVATIH